MKMPASPSERSSRKELQGPRPAPLKVRKNSHKINKPPVPPPHMPPPPVIIYTISPKIIHANPNEFKSLVQRLTGPNSSFSSSSISSSFAFQESVSPAARFASIEKTKSPSGRKAHILDHDTEIEQGIEIVTEIRRTGQFPGILSPNPNALPPIPPNFFSPPSDSYNPSSFYFDLSPVLHSNRYAYSSINNNTMPSPNINMPSPNTLDLFNTLFDL